MVITGKLFKFRYSVDGFVLAPLIVTAHSMEDADAEMRLYVADQTSEHAVVRVFSATEIDVSAL